MKSPISTWRPPGWKTYSPKAPRSIVLKPATNSPNSSFPITTLNSAILTATPCTKCPRFRGLNIVITKGPGKIILLTALIHPGGELEKRGGGARVKNSTNIIHCQTTWLFMLNKQMHYFKNSEIYRLFHYMLVYYLWKLIFLELTTTNIIHMHV